MPEELQSRGERRWVAVLVQIVRPISRAGGDLVFLQKVNKKSSASHETRPDERKTAAWEARNKGIRDKDSGLDSQ